MEQINFTNSDYDHKEELKTFIDSLNDLIDRYDRSFANRNVPLEKIEKNISNKRNALKDLESANEELLKREKELETLKSETDDSISELEAKIDSIDFTDSEVKKMEREDIESLIASKKNKISKITSKIQSTRDKKTANEQDTAVCQSELSTLNEERNRAEKSLSMTENILKTLLDAKNNINREIADIIGGVEWEEQTPVIERNPFEIEETVSNPTVDIVIPDNKEAEDSEDNGEETSSVESDYSIVDFDTKESFPFGVAEESKSEEEPIISNEKDISEPELSADFSAEETDDDNHYIDEAIRELERISNTQELSILDVDDINANANKSEEKEETQDDGIILENAFAKEGLDYSTFDEDAKTKFLMNPERVIKNMDILKKYRIPLDLTLNQADIYTDIDTQDLDDLLGIVTTDGDGNGMGFGIEYTFYILNELSKTDVDKLIDVYNNEFMNVNSKSGLIGLLKLANSNIGTFTRNREANIEALKSLGVVTSNEIAKHYPDFINMDNPLFMNSLNIFDKDDLVSKLNDDIKIIPKIMDYWKNN